MIVYFIQAGVEGPVKIGITGNLSDRLRALQTAHHQELSVLFSFEVEDERAAEAESHLHGIFNDHYIRGEWFNTCPFMFELIEKIKKDGFWVDRMEEYEYFIRNDPFSQTYNTVCTVIDRIRAHGDSRYIHSMVRDLEELKHYAATGRLE